MTHDFGREWLQILTIWPFAFGAGLILLVGWRVLRRQRGDQGGEAPLASVALLWLFGSLIVAIFLVVGPVPIDPDDYPFHRD
jgi:hypothetical protein